MPLRCRGPFTAVALRPLKGAIGGRHEPGQGILGRPFIGGKPIPAGDDSQGRSRGGKAQSRPGRRLESRQCHRLSLNVDGPIDNRKKRGDVLKGIVVGNQNRTLGKGVGSDQQIHFSKCLSGYLQAGAQSGVGPCR